MSAAAGFPHGAAAELAALIAAATHRMSQPLTVLGGTAEMALRRELAPAEYRAALAAALRESERLAALTEALRALAGAAPARCADPAEFAAALSLAVEHVAPLAAAAGARLKLQMDLPPPAPPAPETRALGQALLRLLSAAAERAGAGGCVTLATATEAAAVTLQILDDGPPLAADEWRRRRDPFAANADIPRHLAQALARAAILAGGGALEPVLDPSSPGNRLLLTLPFQR